jgi:hypothetical protein
MTYSQKLFTKLVAKVSKVLPSQTQTTNTLSDIVISGGMESNLPSDKLGTMNQALFPGWKTGGDLVAFTITKKSGTGYYKVDGKFTVDGVEAEYMNIGTYSYISEGSKTPKKVELSTSTGEKASFTLAPNKSDFKVVSINGQTDNISIDLTKDVVIELSGTMIPDDGNLKVSLAINQVSIKAFFDVCYIKSGSTITIPAAAFRNINISPASTAVYNYKKSFLAVGIEQLAQATDVSGSISSLEYTQFYSDGKMVEITKEPVINTGLSFKGEGSSFNYEFFKAGAFASRPFEQIKKIGLLSFSIRGTTYKEVSESTTTTTGKMNPFGGVSSNTTKTTISITKEFPWEPLLEKLYPEFMAVIESEFGATVLPVETVTDCKAYETIEAFATDDESNVEFARSYRDTKVISAFMPISEGYGTNSVYQRVLNEVDADALVTMTLDLQTGAGPNNEAMIIPKFAFEITGKVNGIVTTTKFCTGSIVASSGVLFSNDITPEELEKIIRASDIVSLFRQGIQDLKAKEKANGDYEPIWNLQKK